MGRVAESVYATALFEAAMEEDRLADVLEEVRAVRESIKQNPEILKLLSHPNIEIEDKLEVVDKIFNNKVDDLITGLIIQAVKKGHGAVVKKILDEFVTLARNELGIGEAYVTSAFALDDEKKAKIHDRLIETTGHKAMRIHFRVDETLIGGLVIKIGDRIVDSSLKTRLSELKSTLL